MGSSRRSPYPLVLPSETVRRLPLVARRIETTVRFEGPFFHGIDYAKTGWVISTVVERPKRRSFIPRIWRGSTIEDDADWILEEGPDVLVLAGPPTDLLGEMLNETTLQRAVDNAVRILEE